MDCKGFLERFSEFYDGRAADPDAFEAHVAKCADCRCYADSVRRALDTLHTVPEVTVCEDFRPRLQHRIYHIREEALSYRRHGAFLARLGFALAAAALVAVAVQGTNWVRHTPQVALPPIIISQPPPPTSPVVTPSSVRYRTVRFLDSPLGSDALWSRTLYEYSPLVQR